MSKIRSFKIILSLLLTVCIINLQSVMGGLLNAEAIGSSSIGESTPGTTEVGSSKPEVGSSIPGDSGQSPTEPGTSLTQSYPVSSISSEEYFSKIRVFKNDPLPDKYNNYAYFINSKEIDPYFYKEGNGENYILRENIDTNEVEVVFAKNVSSMYCTGSNLVCIVNNSQIVQIDMEGKNEILLYEDKDSISDLWASSELIFFVKNNTIYRLYRPTKEVSQIFQNSDMVYYEPISNVEIKWEINNPQWIEYYNETHDDENTPNIPRRITNYYNLLTGEAYQKELVFNAWEDQELYPNSKTSASNDFDTSFSAQANFQATSVTLPLSDFPAGSYFTTTGNACTCHTVSTSSKCSYEHPGDCRVFKHPIFGDSIQCLAFARYVYNSLFGDAGDDASKINEEVSLKNPSTVGKARAKSYFSNFYPGAHVRVDAGDYDHSFIIQSINDDGITIYDANWSGPCQVSTRTYTYEAFASRFSLILYAYCENYHVHNYQTKYNTEQHWQACTISGCNMKIDEAPHKFTITKGTAEHSKSCSCGQVVKEPHSVVKGKWSLQSSPSKHYQVCTVCNQQINYGDHVLGGWVKNSSNHRKTCSVCNNDFNIGNHTFKATYRSGDSYHTYTCTTCGYYYTEAHNSNTWQVNSQTGDHYKKCSVCSAEFAKGKHDVPSTWSKNSTQHFKKCSTCGCSIYSTAHSFKYTTSAYSNYHNKVCTVCNYSELASHSLSSWITNANQHYKTCSICKATVDQNYHSRPSSWTQGSSAHTKSCTVCGRLLESQSHSFTAGSMIKVGQANLCRKRLHTCSACKYSYWENDTVHFYYPFSKTCNDCGRKK